MELEGIHHVTCITADAPSNADFYVRVMGLRIVKKTINQTDLTTYHIFYGDEQASYGNNISFFEYRGRPDGRAGAGNVHRIVWRVGSQEVVAGPNASLLLHFHANDVYIVLGGEGTVHAFVDGKPTTVLHVDAQRLYTVRSSNKTADATLELKFTPGVQGYSFTFG